MNSERYPEKFKIEAVKQVTERGCPVAEVASRIGMSQRSPYQWITHYACPKRSVSKRGAGRPR